MSADAFRRQRIVRQSDIDNFGHVNNVVWVRFVIELASAHSKSLGCDVVDRHRLGLGWVVQRHEIDYLGVALEGDILAEETWIEEIHGARSLRASRISRKEDILLYAQTSWVLVDLATGRPRRIPKKIKSAFLPSPNRG